MRLQRYIVLSLVWLFLGSCVHQEVSRLEQALQLSGENRGELEKVLAHFSQSPADSLRRRAAIFLIENMPGHWGVDSASVRDFKQQIDSLPNLPYEHRLLLYEIPARMPHLFPGLERKEDIGAVRAEELIRHIDRMCELKEKRPWLKHLSFEYFCDYVLPYRIGNELLGFLPDTLFSQYADELEHMIKNYDDCRHSAFTISDYFARQGFMFRTYGIRRFLWKKFVNSLEYQTKSKIVLLRQAGLPAAIDYKPIRYEDEEEYWYCITVNSQIEILPASASRRFLVGKIYRQTYSAQEIPKPSNGEYVPPFFRNPFQKDVSGLYWKTVDVSLPVTLPAGLQYAYLAVHDGKEWQPTAFARERRGMCHFKDLVKECVYLPVCYPEGGQQVLGEPFILRSDGSMEVLEAVSDSVVYMQFERLTPYLSAWGHNDLLLDAHFECSDDADFTKTDTVYVIKESPYFKECTITLPSRIRERRYWRLYLSKEYASLSKLHFLDRNGHTLKGNYIYRDTSHLDVLTDNDPQT
ncbi:MAG: hypothetical protein K2M86_06255, partial [Odoribacter sp.]|nr:hypothetical protein [Odoribacter sp.]